MLGLHVKHNAGPLCNATMTCERDCLTPGLVLKSADLEPV
uniref:Uncharacterized protein n=1 Tax=Anguilla anguilla TaxID=7936 RepID=A0A0E9X0J5_ANGAN